MAYINTLIFFEKLLNRVLGWDPQKQFLLTQLQHQVLGLEIYDLDCRFYFIPTEQNIKISQQKIETDVHMLSGSSGMLVAMLISAWPQQFIQKKQVHFTGNIKALQQYSTFFKAIRPDVLFHLRQNRDNPLIDIFDRSLNVLQRGIKRRMQSLPINVSAYLQEERNLMPPQEEIEDFFDDITLLKQDYDRIEKKIEQLPDSGLPHAEN